MSEEIISRIRNKLTEIEEKENIRILHCVESGSRAWGFASPDSDYDVRFIYARPEEWYLRLDKTRDVIEWQLDDVYDINGWDVQKALRLLHRSNPTLFEWNNSPIVYRTTEEWAGISAELNSFFDRKLGIYHYLSTARHTYNEHLRGSEVRLKKYFYALRPLLACRWIADRETPPPMLFRELMDAELDNDIRPLVEELLDSKTQKSETGRSRRIDELNRWIEDEICVMKRLAEITDKSPEKDWNRLNAMFLGLVKGERQ
jgi:hypothetical protein